MKIDFCFRIPDNWHLLFKEMTVEQRSETLLGISDYPHYEPKDVELWDFFKIELERQFQRFSARQKIAR